MSYATDQMQKARWGSHGSDWPDGHRECSKCKEVKPNDSFHKHAQCKGGYNSVCKACRIPVSKQQAASRSVQQKLYDSAKSRAARKKRDFDIELSDIVIPEVCPVFGTPMTTPSLDRIDSSKGYVKDNVRVISLRANQLKSNATVEELQAVLADLIKISGVCEVL